MMSVKRLLTLVLVLVVMTCPISAEPQNFKVSPHIGSSGFTGITFPIIGSSGGSTGSSGSSSSSQGRDQWAQESSATKRVVNVVAAPKQIAGKRSFNTYSESASFQPTAFDGASYTSDNASKHDFFPGENLIFALQTKPYHYTNAKRHYDRETRILTGKTQIINNYAERQRPNETKRPYPGETRPQEGQGRLYSGAEFPYTGETGPQSGERQASYETRPYGEETRRFPSEGTRPYVETRLSQGATRLDSDSTQASTNFLLDPSVIYSPTAGSGTTSSYVSEQERAEYNAKRNSSSRFFTFNTSTQTLDLGLSFTVPFLSVPMSSILNLGQTTTTALTSLLAINWPALVVICVGVLAAAVILPYIAQWVTSLSTAYKSTEYSSSTTGSMYGRSLEEDPAFFPVAPFTSIISQLDDALAQYDLDSTSCMQRIVCSYVSSSEENMKSGKASSTDLIINGIAKSSLIERVFGKTSVTKAIDVGRSGASCSLQYPKCPFSISGILRFLASYATVAT